MKVLHVAQTLAGGVASYLGEVSPYQIDRHGHENIHFLLPREHAKYFSSEVPPNAISWFKTANRDPLSLLDFSASLVRVARSFEPDVIHLHSTFAGAIGRAVRVLLPRRCRIVYCAHGWAFDMEARAVNKFAYRFIELILSPLADHIIAISQHDYQSGLKAGIPLSKLSQIYNGVSASGSHHSYMDRKPGINLLFAGRYDRQKGLDILLSAFEEVASDSMTLHLCGGAVVGEGSPIPSGVHIVNYGWQPRRVVRALMRDADAVVIPSRWEGFGLVAAEAMAEGTAVLASTRGALVELVVDGETGYLFDITDRTSLVSVLRSLDLDVLKMMGSAGKDRQVALFSARMMNERITDVYENVTSCTAAGRIGI